MKEREKRLAQKEKEKLEEKQRAEDKRRAQKEKQKKAVSITLICLSMFTPIAFVCL